MFEMDEWGRSWHGLLRLPSRAVLLSGGQSVVAPDRVASALLLY